MIKEEDLGPPRIVRSMDAWEAEVDRQKRLVESGDLRRFEGATWGWCLSGPHWHWLSRFSTYGGGLWPSRDDREEAWKALEDTHYGRSQRRTS